MKQYFTFGYGHFANDGTPLRDRYVIIEGEDWNDCRQKMVHHFGPKWAFQYNAPEEAGAERYGLTEYIIPESQTYRHDESYCHDTCDSKHCSCICHNVDTDQTNE